MHKLKWTGTITSDLTLNHLQVQKNAQIFSLCSDTISLNTIEIAGKTINSTTVNDFVNIEGLNINNNNNQKSKTTTTATVGLYAGKEGNTLLFREISTDIPTGIIVTQDQNIVQIKTTLGASNIDSEQSNAVDLYSHYDSTSTSFEFKQIVPGTNISFIDHSDYITINSSVTSGLQGTQGPKGIVGFFGVQNEIGFLGSEGFSGIQGRLGFQGLPGQQGLQGSQGQQGSQGTVVSPYQTVSGVIKPISASTIATLSGSSNSVSGTNTVVTSGTSNIVAGTRNIVIGGTTNDNQVSNDNGIISSSSSSIINTCFQNVIFGGTGHSITQQGVSNSQNCVIFGGTLHSIAKTFAGNGFANLIVGGYNHALSGENTCTAIGGTSFLIAGINNTIVGGSSNQANVNLSMTNNFMAGGDSNSINRTAGGGTRVTNNSLLVGGSSHIIQRTFDGSSDGVVILGGFDSTLFNSTRSSILGGTTNIVNTGNSAANAVIGGSSNSVTNATTSSFVGGGSSNIVTAATGGGSRNTFYGSVFAGSSNVVSCSFDGSIFSSSVLGGLSNSVLKSDSSLAMGSSATASAGFNNCFVWSDGAATTSSSVTRQFRTGCAGGAKFFSDDVRTIGVTLNAGASSWSAVSDRNLKENIEKMNHLETLEILMNKIETYQYNFIGNNKEMICYGPMAQNWNLHFGENNNTKSKWIHQGNFIGILFSSIKGLLQHVERLENNLYD
jgi:hypothetical protein